MTCPFALPPESLLEETAEGKVNKMPRAATRAISTSFATGSHKRTSSVDQPVSSNTGMYPSPRPSKASQHLSSKTSAPPTTSPSTRAHLLSSAPVTPPPAASSSKRKRSNDAQPAPNATDRKERRIKHFLDNYDVDAERELRFASTALQQSIDSARIQMETSMSAYPRHILDMRLEDFLQLSTSTATLAAKESSNRGSSKQSVPPPHPHKTPRMARAGETVYSARGSPLIIPQTRATVPPALASSDDEEDNEPSFDTASDKSSSSESLSLPDEAAYTAQVIEEEKRNRILSSEGVFPRSSSMFHRSSGT